MASISSSAAATMVGSQRPGRKWDMTISAAGWAAEGATTGRPADSATRRFVAAYRRLIGGFCSVAGRVRYDALSRPSLRRLPLARAKNTARAAARRRTREQSREAAEIEATPAPPPAEEPRKPLFSPPNIREDIRLLPQMFMTRRLLWVPVLMLLAGFVLAYFYYTEAVPPDLQWPVEMYIQLFFFPQALFTFFLGGFLAPRASYLVGFLLGLFNGLLWVVLVMGLGVQVAPDVPNDVLASNFVMIGVLYGTLAAAFAAWYRNFLRQMQERGKQRRAEREAQERIKQREARRATRRGA
jgi:hypothetical protein